MSLEETNQLIERQAVVKDYIKSLTLDDTTEDYVKAVVEETCGHFGLFLTTENLSKKYEKFFFTRKSSTDIPLSCCAQNRID